MQYPNYISGYVEYFRHLLKKTMDKRTFEQMINNYEQPQIVHVKPNNIYQRKLINDLNRHMVIIKSFTKQSSIIESLKDKFGPIAKVFKTKEMKGNQKIDEYESWLSNNTIDGFISRFEISSLLPYIFLDIQVDDSILSCGLNTPDICEIVSDVLIDGYIFINETDEKRAKSDYKFNHNNYCVLSYPIINIPDIQKFHKILCIAPSTKDGWLQNGLEKREFTLDRAIINHEKQKEYLSDSLRKVKKGGIVVYSTQSLNPFENEAVVNSVLKMPDFKGKFEIVDCSSMFMDIERGKGLKEWDLERDLVSDEIIDANLLDSLSSDSIIDNIENCMRFYPHQIHSCGTFIAVLKKTKDVNNNNNINNQKHISSKAPIFCKIPNEMIQKIIDTFDLPGKCNEIGFILKENKDGHKEKSIYHVNSNLFNLLDKYGFENLNVYQTGCIAFSCIEEYSETHLILSPFSCIEEYSENLNVYQTGCIAFSCIEEYSVNGDNIKSFKRLFLYRLLLRFPSQN